MIINLPAAATISNNAHNISMLCVYDNLKPCRR